MQERKILGETIALGSDSISIHKLKFLNDNPRVYTCTHGEPDFKSLTEEEQQGRIYEMLLEEPSVKNLIPAIKRHGGLLEPILVRNDTHEVVEGNSRLAAYKKLYTDQEEGEWEQIPCNIVSGLTPEQLIAYLHEIHVKGKTNWSAYEKANFAYVRHKKANWTLEKVAKMFGESPQTIRTRIKVIELMAENDDNEHSRFSYYDVLVRNLSVAMENFEFRDFILKEIKGLGTENDNKFTAQELRKNVPVIFKKPKVLKKYLKKEIDLDEGYQRAKASSVEKKVEDATSLLQDISGNDFSALEVNEVNSLKQKIRKLRRAVDRLNKMIQTAKS